MKNIDEILKSIHFESFFNGWIPHNEKINLFTAEYVNSAYWKFEPPHKIVVGKNVAKRMIDENSAKDTEYYIGSYFYHELAHAKYTERDFKKITQFLQIKNVPFNLYNLFEDARVEEKWRKEIRRTFNWYQYEQLQTHKLSDEELFFKMVQVEGYSNMKDCLPQLPAKTKLTLKYSDKSSNFYIWSSAHNKLFKVNFYDYFHQIFSLKDDWKIINCDTYLNSSITRKYYSENSHKNVFTKKQCPKSHCKIDLINSSGETLTFDTFADSGNNSHDIELSQNSLEDIERVGTFYTKTINAKNSFEVIEVCEEWLKTHPNADKNNWALILRDTDSNDIKEIESGDKLQMLSDFQTNQQPTRCEENREYSVGDITKLFCHNDTLPSPEGIKRLTNLFKKVLCRGYDKISTSLPQKTLNLKGLTLQTDKIFKKKIAGCNIKRKRKFALIMDCSGSMKGTPLDEGKVLLLVLNELARLGLIECNIILSASSIRNAQEHLCGTYQLPIKDNDFFIKLGTQGDECFSHTIKKVMLLLKKADHVFVYTDGCITDKVDTNFAHQHGIYAYGLYAGQYDMSKNLLDYFDCAISRNSIEEVINSLIRIIK